MDAPAKTLLIAGVDEAGRGPLAGPVIAAAVIFHPGKTIAGVTDSKKLTAKKRETLYVKIIAECLCYGVGRADAEEIDRLNILQASLLAMQRAVSQLLLKPDKVLVDGNLCPVLSCETEAIVQGDYTVPVISAASIIAKVLRDKEMDLYEQQFPGYGFAEHKGYGTAEHLAAIHRLGITPIHRKSFEPVRQTSLF
jgi:ribonuclease HII